MGEVYHYTECGLDYVWLLDGFVARQTAYGPAVEVLRPGDLDHRIALTLIRHQPALDGREVRFLRGLLDLTQAELGRLLGKDAQTVARWEKRQTTLPATEDRALRQIYLEHTGHHVRFVDTALHVAGLTQRRERLVFQAAEQGWDALEAA